MKPDYKNDRPEAVILWAAYLVLLLLLLAIAWVAWSDDGFFGGTMFGAVLLATVWLTVKFARALDRDNAWRRP